MITAVEFIAKWGPGGPAYALNEEQGAQSHFLDLCELPKVPKPGGANDYTCDDEFVRRPLALSLERAAAQGSQQEAG